jgi:hypothetical protein
MHPCRAASKGPRRTSVPGVLGVARPAPGRGRRASTPRGPDRPHDRGRAGPRNQDATRVGRDHRSAARGLTHRGDRARSGQLLAPIVGQGRPAVLRDAALRAARQPAGLARSGRMQPPTEPTTAITATIAVSRGDEGDLYRRHYRDLEQAVARAVNAPRELVEDACQTAWAILLVTSLSAARSSDGCESSPSTRHTGCRRSTAARHVWSVYEEIRTRTAGRTRANVISGG